MTETKNRAARLPKVLHVVENLHHGAVENWLVRMLGHARKTGVDADWAFYCAHGLPGRLDEKARSLGAPVIHSPVPIGRKAAFARALRNELQRGDYPVIHCHHDLVSAVYLAASIGTPVKKRVVHVHNADESVLTPSKVKKLLLKEPMRNVCIAMADRIAANSNHTLDTFLAGRPRKLQRDVVHLYGIDPAAFAGPAPDRIAFRRELGFANDALILLFAGRLVEEKNPVFAVDLLAELVRREPRAVGVFAGSGGAQADVLARVSQRRLDHVVRMVGWRTDVQRIMRASDWFILPHPEQPMEGFGLAIVEAELAGLRLLLSRGSADDPLLPSATYKRLPLSAGAGAWADAAIELRALPAPSPQRALDDLARSPMNMDRALEGLCKLHQ